MSTANLLGSAIYSKLSAGTALTSLLSGTTAIYRNQAPDKEPPPYVVYSLYAGGPLNVTPSDMREVVYFVRAYASGRPTAARVDDEISALLHKGSLTVTGYVNPFTFRETDLEMLDNLPDGERVYMAGGLYRIALDS
jgi:hypothetical protein